MQLFRRLRKSSRSIKIYLVWEDKFFCHLKHYAVYNLVFFFCLKVMKNELSFMKMEG